MLQGQQAGREIRLQSAERVSLFVRKKPFLYKKNALKSHFCYIIALLNICFLSQGTQFAIAVADNLIVHYGPKKISTHHIKTDYMHYYIGGLPAQLRER